MPVLPGGAQNALPRTISKRIKYKHTLTKPKDGRQLHKDRENEVSSKNQFHIGLSMAALNSEFILPLPCCGFILASGLSMRWLKFKF